MEVIHHKRIMTVIVLTAIFAVITNNASSTYADTLTFSAEIENSLSLSLSSNTAALTLNPGTTPFSTSSITTTVGTNNETGYNIVVTAETTDLTRTESLSDNTTPTIPTLETLAGGYTEESFAANHWGYNKGSGNWLPFETNIELGRTTEPSNADTRTVNFATKVDYTKPSGTYNITLTFAALANPVPYHGIYMHEVDDELLDNLAAGTTVNMRDYRNDQDYSISVLDVDGEKMLWMNNNLKLAAGTTLTSAYSNVSSSFTLSTEEWESEEQNYYCKQIMAEVNGEYYYNWFAANANPYSCDNPTNSESATMEAAGHSLGDICPKGWRLLSAVDLARDSFLALITPTLGYTGGFDSGESYMVGEAGGWWTSTYTTELDRARALATTGSDPFIFSDNAFEGGSVRCVFGDLSMQEINPDSLANLSDGEVLRLKDSRTGEKYGVSVLWSNDANILWMNENLRLPAGTTLTPQDSNVSSNFTLSTEQWTSSSQDYYCKQIMAVANGEYYYNWYAATANTSNDAADPTDSTCADATRDANSKGDICPKGWRLLDFTVEKAQFKENAIVINSLTHTGTFESGHQNVSVNGVGLWWSSAPSDNFANSARHLYWLGTSAAPKSDYALSKKTGTSVRCVLDGNSSLLAN